MNEKNKFVFRLVFGIVLIGASIFLSFRYLWKGAPFVKVMAVGLIVAVVYLVVSFIKSKSNKY